MEFFCFGIEAHERIGPHARFAVPDDAVHDGDSIWPGFRSAGGRPLGRHFAGFGVKAAQIAAPIVAIVEDIVVRDSNAPRTGVFIGQKIFMNGHRFGIDAGDFIGAKFDEVRNTLRGDHHAVGIRLGCGRSHDL